MRLIAKAASLISTVVALTIISVYVVVFHVLRLQHAYVHCAKHDTSHSL